MAKRKAAWGLEIGAYAIKALRLEREGQGVRITDFAYIPHKKVLTTPDVDQDALVRLSLGQFISQKSLEGEHLVLSVPGHSAFARFAKLPPVEPKKVPDIVKFEAVQQIPFPIDQVEWDYQTFMSSDSPEVEVGIFAITRDRVQQRLALYSELNLSPEVLTLSPVAVYNAMAFDHGLDHSSGPVIYLDIGTSATDVIVAEEGHCWIRTFPLGGTHFTEAIASAFKLSYSKAENLKLDAAGSKYAKQIMQAMRPVFSDLLQDLQRSIGYYQTAHSEQELNTMVGLGSTFKIPGLRKFLGQQLQLSVTRLDEYKKIQVTGRAAASFAENAVNLASAYGLALQGVGLGAIDANLVPVKVLRDQIWHAKTKWFGAAAAIVILGAGMMLWRPLSDGQALEPVEPPIVSNVLSSGKEFTQKFEEIKSRSDVGFKAVNMLRLVDHRRIWPHLVHDSAAAMASAEPQDELLQEDVEAMLGITPADRRHVQLTSLDGQYAPPADGGGLRRIQVTLQVELSHDKPADFLNRTVGAWLRENAERSDVPYRIIPESVSVNPDKLVAVTVTETGEELVSQPGRPGSQRPGGGGPKGPTPPPRGTTPPPPTMPAGGGGTGGGARGRNIPTGPKREAPGKGVGDVGSGPGGPGGAAPPPKTPGGLNIPPAGSNLPTLPGGRSAAAVKDIVLEEMAPIKTRPSLYPTGATLYRGPITFQVEIIDSKLPQVEQTARGSDAGEGATS